MLRLFAYGAVSVILVLYLAQVGLGEARIGLLLTLTLLGDTGVSLWLTTRADAIGRRKMLAAGAVLMVLGGAVFALTSDFFVLLAAAMVGVISPSGNEVGPFLSIEQSALADIVPAGQRTSVFAWYNLAGSFMTALGSLCAGGAVEVLRRAAFTPAQSYRAVVIGYAVAGVLLFVLFLMLSPKIEPPAGEPLRVSARIRKRFGLHSSRRVVLRLSALFSLDAFAGGFIIQSIVAYWFHLRFGVEPAMLGAIFFGANVLAGASALSAAWIASRIGLIRTMVFTHIPSNVLLMLIPLMPTLPLAITVLLLRFSISQMDVPTRQSYVMAVVRPDERSAAGGITGVARTIGASLSPVLAGPLLAGGAATAGIAFFLGGGLKIIYDLLLYRSFRHTAPVGEK